VLYHNWQVFAEIAMSVRIDVAPVKIKN